LTMESYQVDYEAAYQGNRIKEARDKLLESIEEVLSFSGVVLNFLELNTSFRKLTILDDPKVFCSELEDLFGAGAYGIEDLIIEKFYGKINLRFVKDRKKSFVNYVNEALKEYVD
jgi:hypothetical protein